VNHGSFLAVVYRRTDKVVRRLAERYRAIIAAARGSAAEGGMAAVQIAPVASRAGIAAGTVYRYFPSKTDLVAAVVAAVSEREIGAMRRAADAAPGPLSALAAAIVTFAARALAERRLAWAVIGEPVDAAADAVRLAYRKALAAELQSRIARAVRDGQLPAQDARHSATAAIGALLEGLIGPLAPETAQGELEPVQALTLFVLRGLGIPDARARGLVVSQATDDGGGRTEKSSVLR
jgi:AcrR family transcriptional regulator